MKKIIAMIIACLMVVALVPVIAAPAAAADKVVYVGKDGTGDGSAADKPLGNLVDAFAAIGDENGTIVFVNMYESKAEHQLPAHAGHITLTTKYNGTDYNGGIYASGTGHLWLGGDTTFTNINVNLKSTWVIRARFNHITFDAGVNVTNDAGTFPQLYVVGADNNGTSDCDPSKDTHITLKSGKFQEVIGAARSNFPSDITGKVIVEVAGDAEIAKLAFGNRSTKDKINLNTALVVIDGGTITNWLATGDQKTTGFVGDVQIVLTKNFDISKSFDGYNGGDRTSTDTNGDTILYGISGTSAFTNHAANTLLSNVKLLVDPAIKAAVESSDKLNKETFTAIEEYTYNGTIGSGKLEADAPVVTDPVTTEAPATDAPATDAPVTDAPVTDAPATDAPVVTTEAPADPEPTPSTGDASAVVFAISAACLVAAAAMVFLKKRVND